MFTSQTRKRYLIHTTPVRNHVTYILFFITNFRKEKIGQDKECFGRIFAYQSLKSFIMNRPTITTDTFFDTLTLSERLGYIVNLGKYIGERNYDNYHIVLHLADEVFYEVWYIGQTCMIERIEPLRDLQTIDLYINEEIGRSKIQS